MVRPLRARGEGGKGRTTEEKELFWRFKKSEKNFFFAASFGN